MPCYSHPLLGRAFISWHLFNIALPFPKIFPCSLPFEIAAFNMGYIYIGREGIGEAVMYGISVHNLLPVGEEDMLNFRSRSKAHLVDVLQLR